MPEPNASQTTNLSGGTQAGAGASTALSEVGPRVSRMPLPSKSVEAGSRPAAAATRGARLSQAPALVKQQESGAKAAAAVTQGARVSQAPDQPPRSAKA